MLIDFSTFILHRTQVELRGNNYCDRLPSSAATVRPNRPRRENITSILSNPYCLLPISDKLRKKLFCQVFCLKILKALLDKLFTLLKISSKANFSHLSSQARSRLVHFEKLSGDLEEIRYAVRQKIFPPDFSYPYLEFGKSKNTTYRT